MLALVAVRSGLEESIKRVLSKTLASENVFAVTTSSSHTTVISGTLRLGSKGWGCYLWYSACLARKGPGFEPHSEKKKND